MSKDIEIKLNALAKNTWNISALTELLDELPEDLVREESVDLRRQKVVQILALNDSISAMAKANTELAEEVQTYFEKQKSPRGNVSW